MQSTSSYVSMKNGWYFSVLKLPVVSKCGRVVGFKASDRYRSDDSGSQRCSMVMTLTTNRKEDNPTHREASSYLLDQEKGRLETKVVNNTEEMQKFYDNGTSFTCNWIPWLSFKTGYYTNAKKFAVI